jgi:hypothetical protein
MQGTVTRDVIRERRIVSETLKLFVELKENPYRRAVTKIEWSCMAIRKRVRKARLNLGSKRINACR